MLIKNTKVLWNYIWLMSVRVFATRMRLAPSSMHLNCISAHPEARCCWVSHVWLLSKISIKSLISIKDFLTYEWHISCLSVKGSNHI